MHEYSVVDQFAWLKERSAYSGCLGLQRLPFLGRAGRLGDGSRGRREDSSALALEVGMREQLADFDMQNRSQQWQVK